MLTNKTLKHIIDGLDAVEKDDVYRYLWAEHVREDVESYISDNAHNNGDNDIPHIFDARVVDYVTERYVYDGRYDCNLSYWENIDNLIDEAEHNISNNDNTDRIDFD